MVRKFFQAGGLAALMLALVAGCDNKPPTTQKEKEKDKVEHSHVAPHDGTIIELGDDEYHGEFLVDHKAKEATVYILAKDAKTPMPLKEKHIDLTLKLTPPLQLKMEQKPDKGDPEGCASRYVVKHDAFAKEQEFEGSISVVVNGKPYSGSFKEEPHDHSKK
jgi:hypothetical protein